MDSKSVAQKCQTEKRVRKVKCILFSFVTSFSVVIFLEECISYTKFLPVVFNEVDKKWMLWIERTLQTFLGLFVQSQKVFFIHGLLQAYIK